MLCGCPHRPLPGKKKRLRRGINALYAAVYGIALADGWPDQAKATAGRLRKLDGLIMSHGSGLCDPFGTHPWVCPPHEVFQGLIDELREEQGSA